MAAASEFLPVVRIGRAPLQVGAVLEGEWKVGDLNTAAPYSIRVMHLGLVLSTTFPGDGLGDATLTIRAAAEDEI